MNFEELYVHQEWADAVMWRAVLALGLEDERLRKLLTHMHLVQHAYANLYRGEAPDFRDAASFADLRAIEQWGREAHVKLHAVVPSVAAEPEKIVTMPWMDMVEKSIGRKAQPATARETLLQVPMHSTYHRGQVNARLRELGAEPPLVDYIAWIWFSRPAPEWSQLS